MSKKRIAIDINEVIRNFRLQFMQTYINYHQENGLDIDEDYPYGEFYDMDKSFPFYDETGRIDSNARFRFQYEDYAFEIYARAECMSKNIAVHLQNWYFNVLCDYEPEENPDLLFVSTFESGLSIPMTMDFLARIAVKAREYYFPVDSSTIWDRCDILITANPKLIAECPEGKEVIKINTLYNKGVETKFEYDSLIDLIQDPRNVVNHMIEDTEVPPMEEFLKINDKNDK